MSKINLNIQLITAAILSIGGMVLLFCGTFIDPEGQIHESLLIAFGEVATFAGALFGIDYTYRQKLRSYVKNHADSQNTEGQSHSRDDSPPAGG